MLHIILTILKIIGILLLALICLLLVIILCVLLSPIKYYGNGIYNDEEKEFRLKARYLFGLIRFNADISKDNKIISLKILFKDMMKKKDKKTKKNKTNKSKTVKELNKKDKTKEQTNEKSDDIKIISSIKEAKETLNDKTNNASKETNNINDIGTNTESNSSRNSNSDTENVTDEFAKETKIVNKVKLLYLKIKSLIRKVFDSFKNFLIKLRDINNRKNEYIEFLSDEKSKKAIKEIKKLLGSTFTRIRPKKIKGKIYFGTGSPDTTGQILGLISIFTSNYFKKLKIQADFDNQVMNIDIKFKGRIGIINLAIVALKLYKNERLKEFISFVKQ